MIRIKEDIDLICDIKKYDVILVGTSIKNALSNGFQHKIAKSFPFVKKANLNTRYDDVKKLGTINVISDETTDFPTFVLCYITKGQAGGGPSPDRLDYEALEKCLQQVAERFGNKKIATTIIGASEFDGNGDQDKVMEIIRKTIGHCEDVTLYDYEQEDYRYEDNTIYAELVFARRNKEIGREEYEERMKKYIWERKMGYYTPMPDVTLYELRKIVKIELEKRQKFIYDD